jgi:hypothetical protein
MTYIFVSEINLKRKKYHFFVDNYEKNPTNILDEQRYYQEFVYKYLGM